MYTVRFLFLGVALLSTVALTADARTRHHRRAAAPAVPAAQSDIPMTDPNRWCTGGFPITDDQQIRGCTALITSRDKELRATAYYNRGNAHFSRGDLATAISDYGEALQLKPDYLEALNNRAVAHRATKNFGMAIMDYSQVLKIAPRDVAALTGRGTAYGMKGDNERAIADLTQAITIGTRDVTARLQRGHAFIRLQRWAEAQADYEQVLAAAPSNPEAFFGRACAKVFLGDAKGGNADLTQAYLLDQSILETMVAQGISSPIVAKPTESAATQGSSETPTATPPPAAAAAPAPPPVADTPPAMTDAESDQRTPGSQK
jgi:tetratricopeptide (TPR) repeat protein